jgi:hypothetical protein
MEKRGIRSKAQWFGCKHCQLVWLGGTLPHDSKQQNVMFEANHFCLECNRNAQFHGGFIPPFAERTTIFEGPANELHLVLKELARTEPDHFQQQFPRLAA